MSTFLVLPAGAPGAALASSPNCKSSSMVLRLHRSRSHGMPCNVMPCAARARFHALLCNAMAGNAGLRIAVPCSGSPCSATFCAAVRCHALRCNAMVCNG
eukprot:2924924-Pyramimonas_sp.AAC.1